MILTGETKVFNAEVSSAECKKFEAVMTQPKEYVVAQEIARQVDKNTADIAELTTQLGDINTILQYIINQ